MNYYNELGSYLGEFAGLFLGIGILMLVIVIAFVVLIVSGKLALFKKAGKNGWEAIIPFYSDWVYVEIAGLNWWWFLLVSASFIVNILDLDELEGIAFLVNIISVFFCNYNISKKLHKDTGFAILMTLFPFIMIPLIGFSNNYQWDFSVKVSKNGLINDSNDNTNSGESGDNKRFCTNCGHEISNDTKYCSNCGTEVK